MSDKSSKNPYQNTLNLPTTTFSIRANAAEKEPEILSFWKEHSIARKVVESNKKQPTFLLHDGPPYANGPIHIGHALNKTLKDVVGKSKRMAGYHVPFVCGWDCHGLPIELKVAAQQKEEGDNRSLKSRCRAYAQKWIDHQKQEFEDLGVFADEKYYSTMSFEYEAATVKALASFVQQGFIERKGKTVPWCASCQTVLAVAEIEYQDRKDPSCYVRFELTLDDAQMLFPLLFEREQELTISLLAWTTTPWTLPLNRAIVLNPSAEYVLLKEADSTHAVIIAADLVEALAQSTGKELTELCRLDSLLFQGKFVKHAIDESLMVPILLDDAVLVGEGTAVLHTAPGCGPDDYHLALKHGIEIFSPLSADGCYTTGIQPEELVGMKVADGQWWVLKRLKERGLLFHKGSIKHSYPHCWRCHQGLMFRATDQWFCDLQKNGLVEKALKQIGEATFIPEWGKTRLKSFVSNRYEWCISRQRSWGVPIPALMCSHCSWTYMNHHFIESVAQGIEKEGIEYWDHVTLEELKKAGALPSDFSCDQCQESELTSFIKEKDTLDVWFDSGVSHYAVLNEQFGLTWPADLYLEGSDQHRGWFQSSLLCGMVLFGKAPYKSVLTHGYVLNEDKRKMSKSLGNVIAPQNVIAKLSRDILRLWAVTVDYEHDVVISEKLLNNVAEVYRKLRNTARFLLSNLYDFNVEQNAVNVSRMSFLDQLTLARLYEINRQVKKAYEEYNFAAVVQLLNNYCVKELSALYLDIVKDRLYCDKQNGESRKAAQTVLFAILDTLVRLMAPITSFTAEEIFQSYRSEGLPESVHLLWFSSDVDIWEHCMYKFSHLKTTAMIKEEDISLGTTTRELMLMVQEKLDDLRGSVLKSLEKIREKGTIKHSLEASVALYLSDNEPAVKLLKEIHETYQLGSLEDFLKDWFIVSSVKLVGVQEGLEATELDWCMLLTNHAQGIKCPRCWQWSENADAEKQLCQRCCEVVK